VCFVAVGTRVHIASITHAPLSTPAPFVRRSGVEDCRGGGSPGSAEAEGGSLKRKRPSDRRGGSAGEERNIAQNVLRSSPPCFVLEGTGASDAPETDVANNC